MTKKGFLGYGSPEELERAIETSQAQDDTFMIYSEGLCFASVCSSLPFEEVKRRMGRVISGTDYGWQFAGRKDNPLPCELKPETHKHYLLSC